VSHGKEKSKESFKEKGKEMQLLLPLRFFIIESEVLIWQK
jgi:hypothetical protein